MRACEDIAGRRLCWCCTAGAGSTEQEHHAHSPAARSRSNGHGRRAFGESVRIPDSIPPRFFYLLLHGLVPERLGGAPLSSFLASGSTMCISGILRCDACRICQASCGARYNDVGCEERCGAVSRCLVKAATHIHLRFSACQINPPAHASPRDV